MDIEITPELERKTLDLFDLFKRLERLERQILLHRWSVKEKMQLLIEIANVRGKINHGLDLFPAEVFMSRTGIVNKKSGGTG